MKHVLLAMALALSFSPLSANAPTSTNKKTVYICNSKNAKAYHSKANCRGLNRCKYEPEAVTKAEAKSLGLRPCKICY